MKIIFFGDSITDANRKRSNDDAGRAPEEYSNEPRALGSGYVFMVATELYYEKPNYYQILNRGIGGDRLPQLYARIALDVWREQPDVVSIMIGANDMQRGKNPNATDIQRWGRVYRMMIEDTLEKCPDTKIILCEPYTPRVEHKEMIAPYAEETRKIAKEFSLTCISFQEKVDEALEKYGLENCCYDGGHPSPVGSKVLADEWLRVFRQETAQE